MKQSDHPLKEEIILCLLETIDGADSNDDSEDWVKLVDRGGLKHVNSNMFMLMVSMELALQGLFNMGAVSLQGNIKQKSIEQISADNDVQSQWAILSAGWESDEKEALFPLIVNLWVTMCGFAFVSAWVEQHKQLTKKCMQKSKGIRKQLL